MKKILIALFVLIYSFSFGQVVVVRTTGVTTPEDIRLMAGQNLVIPRFVDTTNANTNLGVDSCSALIFTYNNNAIWYRACSPKRWLPIGTGSLINDTLFAQLPRLFFDSISPNSKIIKFRENNNVIGGIVTLDSCRNISISPGVATINYNAYSFPLTTLTVPASDPTNPRQDYVIIDTFGVVSVLTGIPATPALPPAYNPSSQFVLAFYTIGANASCLSITPEIIYDGIIDNPAQWDTATAGTITLNFSNTDNPFHLNQDLFISKYTNGSSITFTKPSGNDTALAGSLIKIPMYFNGAFTNQIQVQFYLSGLPVSNNLVINPYFNANDSNQYQTPSIPLSAWSFSGGNIFNGVAFTFAGYDTSGAKGLYWDYFQLQFGNNNIIPANFFVDSTKIISGNEYYYKSGIPYLAGAVGGIGGNSDSTLQQVTNGSIAAGDNPTQNFHGTNYSIDSANSFLLNLYNGVNGSFIQSLGVGYSRIESYSDSATVDIESTTGDINNTNIVSQVSHVDNNGDTHTQSLYIRPDFSEFTAAIGPNPTHAKVVIRSIDTLSSPPTMVYVPDADTMKLYPFPTVGTGTGKVYAGGHLANTNDSTINADSLSTNLRNEIALKLNISDTTGKWVNNVTKNATNDSVYVWKGTGYNTYKDSIGINSLPNLIDTLYRTPGKDSIQYTIKGRYHAIKDSTGAIGVSWPLSSVLIQGNNTQRTIIFNDSSATSTGGLSTMYVQPKNYDSTYGGNWHASRFKQGYQSFYGVNADGRPNVVGLMWGYNGGFNSPTFVGEPTWGFRTETWWDLSTGAASEFHLPEFKDSAGNSRRINSYYVTNSNGNTIETKQIDQFDIFQGRTDTANFEVQPNNAYFGFKQNGGITLQNTRTPLNSLTITLGDSGPLFSIGDGVSGASASYFQFLSPANFTTHATLGTTNQAAINATVKTSNYIGLRIAQSGITTQDFYGILGAPATSGTFNAYEANNTVAGGKVQLTFGNNIGSSLIRLYDNPSSNYWGIRFNGKDLVRKSFMIGWNLDSSFKIDNTKNIFMKYSLSIGSADPTARLMIDSSTSTAGTGQLKFVSGTPPTTPEIGLMNMKNGLWLIDSSNSVRDTVATRSWTRNNISGGGGGTGTVTSIATGYGLSGGTITTTGTIIADSATLHLKFLGLTDSTNSITGYTTLYQNSLKSNIASPTFTGTPAAPTPATGDNTTKIATTAFTTTAINNAVAGVNPAVAVQAATTANVSGYTYNNGVSGIGATLTQNSAAIVVIDGYTLVLNDRVLFKNQTAAPSGSTNGVYFISTLGTGIIPAVFTRAVDYDQSSDINNTGAIPVVNGTVNATTSWLLTSSVTTVGTDALTYTQFTYNPSTIVTSSTSAGGSLTGTYPNPTIANLAVTNAMIAATTIDLTAKVTGTLPIANGGTNNGSLSVTAGTIYYGDGTKLLGLAPGNANQILHSGTTPIWKDTTALAILGVNTFTGTQTITSAAPQVILGVNTTTAGKIKLFGVTSGDVTIKTTDVAGTATVVTLPNATSTLPIFGQQITFSGPSAARTVTLPDANFTAARTDAANTFTGIQTLSSAPVLSTGTVTVSGNTVTFPTTALTLATLTGTETLTNKRWTARVGSTTSSATPTINTDNVDIYKLTAQTADITSFTTNLSGTPVDGDILEIQVTGTAARALTFGASFVSSTVTIPTTTVTTATLTIIFQYFSTSSYGNTKWVCVNSF